MHEALTDLTIRDTSEEIRAVRIRRNYREYSKLVARRGGDFGALEIR